MRMKPPSGPKKQTQSKPVLSAVEWANLRKAKMNVSLYVIEDYRKKDDFAVRKNKPNTNPIKPCPERSRMGQSPKSQNERKLICYRGL